VVSRIMQRISHGPPKFWVNWLLEDYLARPLPRVLSVACGSGDHEIVMMETGLVGHIDAFDLSPNSLRLAQAKARAKGLESRIDFYSSSFDDFCAAPPRSEYDAVCFFGALHHVKEIEAVLEATNTALKPDGYLLFNEFVGPAYNLLEDFRVDAINKLAEAMHPRLRAATRPALPHQAPTLAQIRQADPSECVRSPLILPLMRLLFDVELLRPYGGFLLSVLYPLLNHETLNDGSPASVSIMRLLLAFEEILEESSERFRSDHCVGVARPRALE
jgi:ubiquinone/menaquinone biosynthesis C-methylase UbiE